MDEKKPTITEWRELYQAAQELYEAAPWEWMEETDIFGVRNPESGELGIVSVMGALGEHFALAVYEGEKGVYDFWNLHDSSFMGPDPEDVFNIPQLQVSFEDREMLEKEDRAVIKKLKLRFRGSNAWPQFRDYKPGYFPWFINGAQARFLTHVIKQTVDVALRFEEDEDLLDPFDDERYLVRETKQEGETLVWEDVHLAIEEPDEEPVAFALDMPALDDLKAIKEKGGRYEIDLMLMLAPVQEDEKERPFFPYVLLVVDAVSGMVVGVDTLAPKPTLEAMWTGVPNAIVAIFNKMQVRPSVIYVEREELEELLEPVVEELDTHLQWVEHMPMLDEAREAMLKQIMGLPEDFGGFRIE